MEFRQPIVTIRRGRARLLASVVTVPETAVHKYHGPIFWQDDIRISRKVLSIQAKAKAQFMKKAADHFLWLCVPRADVPHYLAPLGFRKGVHSDRYPIDILRLRSTSH